MPEPCPIARIRAADLRPRARGRTCRRHLPSENEPRRNASAHDVQGCPIPNEPGSRDRDPLETNPATTQAQNAPTNSRAMARPGAPAEPGSGGKRVSTRRHPAQGQVDPAAARARGPRFPAAPGRRRGSTGAPRRRAPPRRRCAGSSGRRRVLAAGAAEPEQRVVAERDRQDRGGEIGLVAILVQAHPGLAAVEVDQTGLGRGGPAGDGRPTASSSARGIGGQGGRSRDGSAW